VTSPTDTRSVGWGRRPAEPLRSDETSTVEINPTPTPVADLNAVLVDLVSSAREILGDNFVGAYLQGSFGLGDWDEHSDVDWLIVIDHPLSDEELAALQAMHARIYDGPSPWAQHLEGSYFPKGLLKREDRAKTPLHYLDNGARQLVPSVHDNELVVRWQARERGITLAGPDPTELINAIAIGDLKREVHTTMRVWGEEIRTGAYSIGSRWAQAFAVVSYCRMLHTLHVGEITSKPAAVKWALVHADPAWHDLIRCAWSERPDPGAKARTPAEPDAIESTHVFIVYALEVAEEALQGGTR